MNQPTYTSNGWQLKCCYQFTCYLCHIVSTNSHINFNVGKVAEPPAAFRTNTNSHLIDCHVPRSTESSPQVVLFRPIECVCARMNSPKSTQIIRRSSNCYADWLLRPTQTKNSAPINLRPKLYPPFSKFEWPLATVVTCARNFRIRTSRYPYPYEERRTTNDDVCQNWINFINGTCHFWRSGTTTGWNEWSSADMTLCRFPPGAGLNILHATYLPIWVWFAASSGRVGVLFIGYLLPMQCSLRYINRFGLKQEID